MVKRGRVKTLGSWGGDILWQFGAEMERTEKNLMFACNLQKQTILRGISSQRINVQVDYPCGNQTPCLLMVLPGQV